MRISLTPALIPVVLLPLAGCMEPTTAAAPAASGSGGQGANAATDPVWDGRQPVSFDGKVINIAVSDKQTYALVGYSDFGDTVTVAELTAVAAQATGCGAKDASGLGRIAGAADAPVPTASIQAPGYLRVNLDC